MILGMDEYRSPVGPLIALVRDGRLCMLSFAASWPGAAHPMARS